MGPGLPHTLPHAQAAGGQNTCPKYTAYIVSSQKGKGPTTCPKAEAHIPKAEKSVLFSLVNTCMEFLSFPRQSITLTFMSHRSGSLKCLIAIGQLGEDFNVCFQKEYQDAVKHTMGSSLKP